MDILSPIIGFAVGAIVMLIIWKLQQGNYATLGTISPGDVTCYAGGTMLKVPYTILNGPATEVRAMTYNSTAGTPQFEDATEYTSNPIHLPYSASSSHDRVALFAAFPGPLSSAALPDPSSCSSGGGSGSSLAYNRRSVLP
ncbi:hypothetical protein UC8_03030 [Roseimaritima ulvae]|uniref:Uncharacterized protein n=1 Tax=Roseimaritima ulvae TaxID=980254 RepID=A0A5B9QMW0_9BACT|nr:hypothetical protein UC8_03030 [Roseimaritima ulvae]